MTKQTRLATVFVELAYTLVEDFDVIEQARASRRPGRTSGWARGSRSCAPTPVARAEA